MSKFFVKKNNISENEIVITNPDDIKHITKVLRYNSGDTLKVSDEENFDYNIEIKTISKSEIKGRITDKQRLANEPDIKITLFQGIPKQTKMELVVQKNVEIGVHEIIPVFMARTIVNDKGNFNKKIIRWNKISHEASCQCNRDIVPAISDAIDFKKMTELLSNYDLIVFPYENEYNYTIKSLLQSLESKPKNLAIIIGPEGGFSDKEAQELKDMDIMPVSLGKTVLRTETAGFVAMSMIMYELELV